MDIIDALGSSSIPVAVKHMLIDLMEYDPELTVYSPILTPTAENNDVNGSQGGLGGELVIFTYEDAPMELFFQHDLTFGTYGYFSRYHRDIYTGNQYDGDGNLFAAAVVNPPAYAVSHRL
jgi:hypothetical protein